MLECWVAALKESIHNEGRWPQWGAPSFVQLCEHPRLVRSLCLLVCNYVSSGDRDPHSVGSTRLALGFQAPHWPLAI